jgi:hypothetical protein
MAQPDRRSAQSTENSTIVSLCELMRLEQVRIDEEKQRSEDKRREREQAQRRAREARERELEAERQASEEARKQREESEMQEAAALAGKILGFIARAKAEAEHELGEKGRQQAHARALELEHARSNARVASMRWALGATCVGAILLVGGMIAAYAGVLAPAHDAQVAVLRTEVSTHQRKVTDFEKDLARERDERRQTEQQRTELVQKLAAATLEAERLRKELDDKNVGKTTVRSGPTAPATDLPPPCPPEDPMCGLHGRRL